jgi:hypothetical protein
MNTDEKAIIDYLKAWPNSFVSGREIARKVGGKARYDEDRFWAASILAAMVTKGWLETDFLGSFRLRRDERRRNNKLKRHIAPQILRILKSSGKSFDSVTIDDDDFDGLTIRPLPKSKAPSDADGEINP